MPEPSGLAGRYNTDWVPYYSPAHWAVSPQTQNPEKRKNKKNPKTSTTRRLLSLALDLGTVADQAVARTPRKTFGKIISAVQELPRHNSSVGSSEHS